MPKSKVHAKRRAKSKKTNAKTNKWVKRKVKAFRELPESAQQQVLKGWRLGKAVPEHVPTDAKVKEEEKDA